MNAKMLTLQAPPATAADRLETMLQRRLGNRIRELRVLQLPSGIILQGRSATYHAKQLATHAAMELSDLPVLANEIEVL